MKSMNGLTKLSILSVRHISLIGTMNGLIKLSILSVKYVSLIGTIVIIKEFIINIYLFRFISEH